jgi:hypothetical protein
VIGVTIGNAVLLEGTAGDNAETKHTTTLATGFLGTASARVLVSLTRTRRSAWCANWSRGISQSMCYRCEAMAVSDRRIPMVGEVSREGGDSA